MKIFSPRLQRASCFVIFLVFGFTGLFAQVSICSWNIQHMGKSKSAAEIEFMANTLRDFDIVALQEVVAGNGGAQAVARLAAALNRKGAQWDYVISDPTQSSTPYASERYAYLWKTARVKNIRRGWLEQQYVQEVDREPFLMDFEFEGCGFTLVNFHAIPKKKQPETEIKYFKFLPPFYGGKNLVFLGDFNVPQSHTVFNPLRKMGYLPVLVGQKTSLKMKCVSREGREECLASEYDNIFYNSNVVEVLDAGILRFYESFPEVKDARVISDHVPVWAEFDFEGSENYN